jgi:hypothetical protein
MEAKAWHYDTVSAEFSINIDKKYDLLADSSLLAIINPSEGQQVKAKFRLTRLLSCIYFCK